MVALRLVQVRSSSAGSRARYFQKLFTSGTLRVFLMSSNTARTSREALRGSMGLGMDASLTRCCSAAVAAGILSPALTDCRVLHVKASGAHHRRSDRSGARRLRGAGGPAHGLLPHE